MRSVRSIALTAAMLSCLLAALASLTTLSTIRGVQAEPAVARGAKVKPVMNSDTTGISFAQITSTFDSCLHFEPTSPSQGLPRSRAVAQDEHRSTTMFVTGSQSDIHDAQLFVGMPQGSQEVTKSNAAMVVQFAKNAVPGWSGAEEWVTQNGSHLLKQARHHVSVPSASIVRDNKRIVLALLVKPGILAIDVKRQ